MLARTREDSIVTSRLFGIVQGSPLSRELAALLGIADAWDFSQHHIEPPQIDVADMPALLAAGFDFHFRPEG